MKAIAVYLNAIENVMLLLKKEGKTVYLTGILIGSKGTRKEKPTAGSAGLGK